MAEPTITEKLDAVRRLLREGRTTEADVSLDTLEKEIRDEEERIKMSIPPPGPLTLIQLERKFKVAVTDMLGNNPRLTSIITEIDGRLKDAEQ